MTLKLPLLWPLSIPYGAVARLRARAYAMGLARQQRLDGVVISVGNLTVGGTGKTPMVMWIAERLLAEGKRLGILTRGYGARPPASRDSPEGADQSSSDEVQLMKARLGPRVVFGVGANRFEKGREVAKKGIDWFVLDDGFQHLRLARDVDIVLIDATNPFGGGHVLPAGLLREPRSSLARADIVVITRSEHSPAIEAAVRRDSEAAIFYARPCLESIRVWKGPQPSEEPLDAKPQNLFAFCGIGNPPAFLADLKQWGFKITGHKFFPDHHRYTQRDVDAITSEAAFAGAGPTTVICTEKDLYNFGSVRWHATNVFFCRISMRVDREDEVWRAIMMKAESRKRS